MHDELVRNFEILQDEEKPPFYLSYEIVEDDMIQVTGSYGEVSRDVDFVNRVLTIDLRVGSPDLDNTRVDRTPQRVNFGSLSVEAEQPLKVALWNATNDSYRSALSQLTQVESQVQATVEEEDKTGDFVAMSKEDYRGRSLELGDVREDFRAKAETVWSSV